MPTQEEEEGEEEEGKNKKKHSHCVKIDKALLWPPETA